jgi:hypothetical protein
VGSAEQRRGSVRHAQLHSGRRVLARRREHVPRRLHPGALTSRCIYGPPFAHFGVESSLVVRRHGLELRHRCTLAGWD